MTRGRSSRRDGDPPARRVALVGAQLSLDGAQVVDGRCAQPRSDGGVEHVDDDRAASSMWRRRSRPRPALARGGAGNPGPARRPSCSARPRRRRRAQVGNQGREGVVTRSWGARAHRRDQRRLARRREAPRGRVDHRLSSRTTSRSSPSSPAARTGPCGPSKTRGRVPRPPLPPWATTKRAPAPSGRPATPRRGCDRPVGDAGQETMSAPFLPWRKSPIPCVPFWASGGASGGKVSSDRLSWSGDLRPRSRHYRPTVGVRQQLELLPFDGGDAVAPLRPPRAVSRGREVCHGPSCGVVGAGKSARHCRTPSSHRSVSGGTDSAFHGNDSAVALARELHLSRAQGRAGIHRPCRARTPSPGWKWVPRWQTKISPALTRWPPSLDAQSPERSNHGNLRAEALLVCHQELLSAR